ncbi:ferredoxin-type protein NapF [Aliiroseovarius sp. S1339]|uniref:ferredoxin-type protein NapF n=1 Tax=Aliiroseovarius sp. S1339 TaxID=2936990 RepID=UPI0020C12669|nr:ferredoxin-type protein NapF [Aliiroseovarius sp. S1339]MCK8464701.1 ferredoxin-type protein NapF [Aliiroseovarius sp. S1339]
MATVWFNFFKQTTGPSLFDPRYIGRLSSVTKVASRRAFLKGAVNRATAPRPPGAIAEIAFVEACTQCGDCARACPEHIVIRDEAGYPALNFQTDGCTFCGKCIAACDDAALRADMPWAWQAVVAQTCLSLNAVQCRACEDHCDAGAIRFRLLPEGRAEPKIDPDTCTGCGACIAPCPVSALALHQTDHSSTETRPC